MTSQNKLKPIERSFYAPIIDLLKNKGFKGVQEIGIGNKNEYVDILFRYGKRDFIVEIKVNDSPEELIKGIVQAYRYAQNHNTRNIIIIGYPDDARSPISTIGKFNQTALDRKCKIISLTDVWYDYTQLSVKEFFSTLQSNIDKKISSLQRIETASRILQDNIKFLSNLINKEFRDKKLFDEILHDLTKSQGLFVSLCGQNTTDKRLRNEVIDLLAYILVNQIIFYFLYSRNVEEEVDKIDELKPIDNISDLERYFEQIKAVDFKPIYDINIVTKIPSHLEIVDRINEIIGCLSPLRLDEIEFDLFGKLIGKSLPEQTRERLASYYTKASSADLMIRLLIDKWNETVWDLACGSGTLLMTSYQYKKELYEEIKGELNKKESIELHKKFIETQLTGHDIMPFSCHLTGLNLSAQNLNAKTDFMRVENKNSLEIDLDKISTGKEAYATISNAFEHVQRKQKTLSDRFVTDISQPIKKSEPKEFPLTKVDTIAINPPFTQYNKIPSEFRSEFFRPELTKISGKKMGLWACFLIRAAQLTKNGGKIGAIIPISFLRGKSSKGIRDYYLDNCSFEYIIKPKNKTSFSEDTELTDIILIVSKNPPDTTQETTIILLNKPIDDYTGIDIENVFIKKIKTIDEKEEENEDFSLIKVNQAELQKNRDNLIIFMFGKTLTNIKKINQFYNKFSISSRLVPIDVKNKKIQAGVQFRPEGESKRRLITRATLPSRLVRANYRFVDDNDGSLLTYFDKDGKVYTINKKSLKKTVRTLTGINKFDITSSFDYLISKDNDPKARSKVIFAHKIRLNSSSTHAIAGYSSEEILSTSALTMYFADNDEEAKILTLFFSSIFYIIQFKRLEKKTTEGILEIGETDMEKILLPSLKDIPDTHVKKLLEYFDRNKNLELPSLMSQLKDKTQERVEMDLLFSRALGISLSKKELLDIYSIMIDELSE